jgi:hypothetical protein
VKQPTDRFAADRAGDQLTQRWQSAFQPTATPARCVRGSFRPKSSTATAMQRNYKISVADIGQADLGEAKPIATNGGAPGEHCITGKLPERLPVKDFSCRSCVASIYLQVGSGRRWHDAPGRALFGRRGRSLHDPLS